MNNDRDLTPGERVLIEAAAAFGSMPEKPDPKCNKCYGRGTLGRNVKTGQVLDCPCTKPKFFRGRER